MLIRNINKRAKLFALGLVVIFFSCNKTFLDQPIVPNGNSVIAEQYIKDVQSLENYVRGIYGNISKDIIHAVYFLYPDVVADNIKPVVGSSRLLAQYNWNQISETTGEEPSVSANNMNGFWATSYKVIRSCNYVIENAGKFRNENPDRVDNLLGQAYALRAWMHHNLVIVFAQSYKYSQDASHKGIPYVTGTDFRTALSRQTVKQVYVNAIDDLNRAIELLTPSLTNKLEISKFAAKAILARILLYKGDYAAAKNIAVEVAAKVPLMAQPSYPKQLFTQQDSEGLFSIAPSSLGFNNGKFNTLFSGYYFRDVVAFLATNDIVTIFNERPNDVRNSWLQLNGTNWTIRKYPVGVIPSFPTPSLGYYQTLLRSSEMFLTAAESYAQLGNYDSAKYYLDAVRIRADLTALPTAVSGSMLIDSIFKERRKEFAFEGFRLYDLQRNNLGVNRNDVTNSAPKNLEFGSSKSIAPLHGYDVSFYKIDQNEGY